MLDPTQIIGCSVFEFGAEHENIADERRYEKR